MKKLYFSAVAILFLVVANAQIVNIPNANFKAILLSASSSNQIASTQTPDINGLVTTYTSIDTNNDGEIQVSEASLIKYINVSNLYIASLEGINGFTNLQTLICESNQLTALNVQGLTNLQTLECYWNQLTALNVQGLTNLQVLRCYENQLTTLNVQGLTNLEDLHCSGNLLPTLNVQGLTNLRNLNCSNNQLPTLNVQGLTNLQNLHCQSNQLPTLNVQGLTSLQHLDCSDNLLPTLNVQGLTNLENLNCSYNQLPTLNVQGLTNLQSLLCNNNQLPTLNVQGLTNLNDFQCYNNQLTSLNVQGLTSLQHLDCINNQLTSLFIKNGRNENVYFSGNPNLTYICADDGQITSLQNLATGYGYTNCNVNSYCSFTPGGIFYTINGANKYDSNNNGCDALDISFPNLKFNITNGTVSGSLISNSTGNYSIPVSAGTHTITPQFENPTYFNASPTSATVSFPATTSPFTQNFCIVPNGVHHDLEVVVIPLGVARPGIDAKYKIKYKNKGNQTENTALNFNYNDAILDFVSSSIATTSQAAGTLSWNIGTIAPFQSGEILVTLNLNSPTETPSVNAGNILSYTTTINGINTDETPIDNTFALNQTVVNSFDPNDKKCLEGITISSSKIGEYVHYQIRFENTGTYPAQNIVVKDMIDTTKFDVSTLQMTDASHSCVTKISNTNKVEFIFENINLPFNDATNDGYVVFKIKTKPTLVTGNTISNSANIYFDYNFPIVTNTATSTFQTLANNDFYLDKNVSLSPIPTKDNLTISLQNFEKINSVSIYNMLGQVVQTVIGSSNTINVSELKTGDYIIKITTEKGTVSKKFIKE